jgi:hypothetical protein
MVHAKVALFRALKAKARRKVAKGGQRKMLEGRSEVLKGERGKYYKRPGQARAAAACAKNRRPAECGRQAHDA